MIPAGYMAKRVQTPKGFHIDQVSDVYSVSSCVNDDFADYIEYWKHNGYWLFDSPEMIKTVARENSISLQGAALFYYEVFEREFDGHNWHPFQPESWLTEVAIPLEKKLEGFDVVTFFAKSSPECSPLSCNRLAKDIRTNDHCLFSLFEEAYERVTSGDFNNSEPGPYRIFAVHSLDWPSGNNI